MPPMGRIRIYSFFFFLCLYEFFSIGKLDLDLKKCIFDFDLGGVVFVQSIIFCWELRICGFLSLKLIIFMLDDLPCHKLMEHVYCFMEYFSNRI